MPHRRHPAESFDDDFRACDGGYRSIVQRAPCLIVRYDSHLRICYVNEAVVRASGVARDRWVGRTTEEIGIPGGRLGGEDPSVEDPSVERWNRALREAFETGRESLVELAVKGAGGAREYAMHVLPDRGVDGSVTSVVVVGHDETAHAQAERTLRRELQAREEVLSAALLAAGAGVVEVDRDGRISGWSAAQETLTGVARADAIGRPVWEVQAALLPSEARRPENVERVRAAFAVLLSAAASGREGAPVPFLVERPDGTRRLLEMTAIVDRGGAETGESTGRGALLVTRAVEPRPRADRPGGDHGPA